MRRQPAGQTAMSETYAINEIFLSLQGEGLRSGTSNVFVRFAGCNMECSVEPGPKSPGGFDCDTEFASGRKLTLPEIHRWIGEQVEISGGVDPKWLILTGGEPGLQVDNEFISRFHDWGYKLAIETNGSVELPEGPDWITVSPKVAEHAIRQISAHEVKYVRAFGQAIPKTRVKATYYLISPAFDGMEVHPKTMAWCQKLVLENPQWRLSVQQHKGWRVR